MIRAAVKMNFDRCSTVKRTKTDQKTDELRRAKRALERQREPIDRAISILESALERIKQRKSKLAVIKLQETLSRFRMPRMDQNRK
jgi:exonuclease VII small subunit